MVRNKKWVGFIMNKAQHNITVSIAYIVNSGYIKKISEDPSNLKNKKNMNVLQQ